jgi:hypothetical protein
MDNSHSEFAILEKILSNEIHLFMSDEEVENHIPNSRIKERVHKIGQYEIHIYSRDHDPPHFHVTSKDGSLNARFRINDGSLMSQHGDLRSGVLKRIGLWYNDIKTQIVLQKIWNKRNA